MRVAYIISFTNVSIKKSFCTVFVLWTIEHDYLHNAKLVTFLFDILTDCAVDDTVVDASCRPNHGKMTFFFSQLWSLRRP